jgi:hypothetical protein
MPAASEAIVFLVGGGNYIEFQNLQVCLSMLCFPLSLIFDAGARGVRRGFTLLVLFLRFVSGHADSNRTMQVTVAPMVPRARAALAASAWCMALRKL